MHYSVEQRHIGTGLMLQPYRRKSHEVDPSRVGNYNPGPLPQCLFHPQPYNRMGFSGIRPYYEYYVIVLDFRDGICHGTGAEYCGQTGHGGAVSETGAMVDVVRPHCGPDEFLEEIILFICTPR